LASDLRLRASRAPSWDQQIHSIEDKAGRGCVRASLQHAHLVRVGSGVEVAADDSGMAVSGYLLDEGAELANLGLTYGAGVKRVVEHDDEQLDEVRPGGADDARRLLKPTFPGSGGSEYQSKMRSCWSAAAHSHSAHEERLTPVRALVWARVDASFCVLRAATEQQLGTTAHRTGRVVHRPSVMREARLQPSEETGGHHL